MKQKLTEGYEPCESCESCRHWDVDWRLVDVPDLGVCEIISATGKQQTYATIYESAGYPARAEYLVTHRRFGCKLWE